MAQWAEMTAATPAGRQRRQAFFKAIHGTKREFQGLGVEMNQRYHSNAVYQADQGEEPPLEGDPVLDHTKSTYPGARLPHVWLNKAIPEKPVPLLDLAGHGRFTLLTGIGGEAWKQAANDVAQSLGISIASYSIGFRQDYEDVYFEWESLRGVEEDGCILVRPDRFIAWRSKELLADPKEALVRVLKQILSR